MSSEPILTHPLIAGSGPARSRLSVLQLAVLQLPKSLAHCWIRLGFGLIVVHSGAALAFDSEDFATLQATGSCFECDLSEADLGDVVHGPADLCRANLHAAALAGADLAGAQLGDADLSDADLSEAFLEGASLIGANLERANLGRAALREADLTRANLRGADLSEADLYRASLQAADLQESKLAGASLEASDLTSANLRGADLQEADLSLSALGSADLRDAKMGGASLQSANLRAANLEGADLEGAIVTQATFDCANLEAADLPEPAVLTDRGFIRPSSEDTASDREPASDAADFQVVRVFYGTDRCRVGALDQPLFGAERADWLTFGSVAVTVPEEHDTGKVERPWSFRLFGVALDDEDPAKHFTIHEIDTMSKSVFLDELRSAAKTRDSEKRQLFVFIHGYNMTFDSAAFRTAQIAHDLDFDGAPVMYSWPSRGSLTSYEYDQNSAQRSKRFLKDFLTMLVEQFKGSDIHLVAHSMGNGPLMEVLAGLREEYSRPFRQIVLAAPDIDRDMFLSLAEQMKGVADGVTLYASSKDWAIWASKFWAGGVPRAGDVLEGGPLVLPGVIESIDASAVSASILSLNHSGYAEESPLLKDIKALLRSGAPASERTPELHPMPPHGAPQYWQFQ